MIFRDVSAPQALLGLGAGWQLAASIPQQWWDRFFLLQATTRDTFARITFKLSRKLLLTYANGHNNRIPRVRLIPRVIVFAKNVTAFRFFCYVYVTFLPSVIGIIHEDVYFIVRFLETLLPLYPSWPESVSKQSATSHSSSKDFKISILVQILVSVFGRN